MPKNIVLLSDGTGNSSAKLLKTNVWRVYEALDLDDPSEQVACYDDGVGTSSFKPLALLGGALGFGLKKNVLRLYRFLCEHYDPGDRIYAFGFSRGAFTIRVLIGLVCSQGIVRTRPTSPVAEAYPQGDPAAAAAAAYRFGDTMVRSEPQVFGAELARLCRWAYRDFRRAFNQTGVLVDGARLLRDLLIRGLLERGRPRYDKSLSHDVDSIRFVGVWDTVDAYGLPVDELTDGINKWIWPLSAPDLKLSTKVKRACHVLALDDERNTFHPVLWDESDEPQNMTRVDDERISQVWFAGMHSNVGGGYPDDALSYLSLRWITTEATKCDLKFVPHLLQHHTAMADPFGRIYDSRGGLKAYYRYNPRRIEWLTNGQIHEAAFGGWPKPSPMVTIGRPKIHESVFARIAAAPEAYAPIIFPERYAIVREDGGIIDRDHNPYENGHASGRRVQAQEKLWDLVWWRRVCYFATVFVTIGFLLQPFLRPEAQPITGAERTVIARLLDFADSMIQWIPDRWVAYYSATPTPFIAYAVGILLLMRVSARLQVAICNGMRNIWSQVIPPPGRDLDVLRPPSGLLYRVRSHPYYQGTLAVFRHHLLPNAFGIATLVVLALCGVGLANRVAFEAVNGLGGFCTASQQPTALTENETRVLIDFTPGIFCWASGVELERGARYTISVTLNATDGDSIRVTSPAGFHSFTQGLTVAQRALFVAFAPFRRVLALDWYVPVARIGERGFDQYPLADKDNQFTARDSGELFLFVNDAIVPVGPGGIGWDSYYTNNRGAVTVSVTQLNAAVPVP
jgi:hypothetical protein